MADRFLTKDRCHWHPAIGLHYWSLHHEAVILSDPRLRRSRQYSGWSLTAVAGYSYIGNCVDRLIVQSYSHPIRLHPTLFTSYFPFVPTILENIRAIRSFDMGSGMSFWVLIYHQWGCSIQIYFAAILTDNICFFQPWLIWNLVVSYEIDSQI